METVRDLQRCIDGLVDATWAFSAVVAAIEVGLVGASIPSERDANESTLR